MVFEGVFTWLMLAYVSQMFGIGPMPMAALLGLITGMLAFIPNIGAIVSGVLMVAVGFSAGPAEGVWAIFVYFLVQNIDGYLVVPYIARRTVDLAPALVLAAQLMFGALFGFLGAAARRLDPRDAQGDAGGAEQDPRDARRRKPERRRERRSLGLRRSAPAAAPAAALLHALHQRRIGHDLDDVHVEFEVGVGRDRAARRRRRAIAERRRDAGSGSGRPSASWSAPRRSRG